MELIKEITFNTTNSGSYAYTMIEIKDLSLSGYSNLFFISSGHGTLEGGSLQFAVNRALTSHSYVLGENYGSAITYSSSTGTSSLFARGATTSNSGDGWQVYGWISNPGDSYQHHITYRALGWRPNAGYTADADWMFCNKGSSTDLAAIKSISLFLSTTSSGYYRLYGIRK